MENFTSKNPKLKTETKTIVKCKKHPKHRQSPGVCSICLREKLCKLSSKTRRKNTVSAASSLSSSCSLSSLSSSNASSCSSPVHRSINSLFLTKSRSMAFDLRRKDGAVEEKKKKKNGFWWRLIHTKTSKVEEGLTYSKTVRERGTSRIH